MSRTLRRSGRSLFSAMLLSGLFATAALAQDPGPVGDWEGTLVAGGQEFPLVFHVTADADGALSSTLDSPSQAAFGIPTGETTFEEGTLTITVPDILGNYEGALSEDGNALTGTWTQSGMSLELSLTRVES